MKIQYKKITTTEDEKQKLLKLDFEGEDIDGNIIKFSIKGLDNNIKQFMDDNNISIQGQSVMLHLDNEQRTIDD